MDIDRDTNDLHNQSSAKQWALVTGASSGIGFELARIFAENGFNLVVAAEDDGIWRAAKALEVFGAEVRPLQVDLATEEGNDQLYDFAQGAGEPIEILAVNAGVGLHGDFVRENELREHFNLIHLNILSPVHLIKKFGKDMIGRGHGKVLITSSIASLMPGVFNATYNASKAFLESFGEAIRNELRDTGVNVTTLLPGATETNFFHRAKMQETPVGTAAKDDPADVALDGYKALMAGKDHVVAGSFKNKVEVAVSKILPDTVKANLHRKQARPASKHHH